MSQQVPAGWVAIESSPRRGPIGLRRGSCRPTLRRPDQHRCLRTSRNQKRQPVVRDDSADDRATRPSADACRRHGRLHFSSGHRRQLSHSSKPPNRAQQPGGRRARRTRRGAVDRRRLLRPVDRRERRCLGDGCRRRSEGGMADPSHSCDRPSRRPGNRRHQWHPRGVRPHRLADRDDRDIDHHRRPRPVVQRLVNDHRALPSLGDQGSQLDLARGPQGGLVSGGRRRDRVLHARSHPARALFPGPR